MKSGPMGAHLSVFILLSFSSVRADFNHANFSKTENMVLFQNAALVENRLRLTPAVRNQFGTAWQIDKQPVEKGFETTFQFQITDRGATQKRFAHGGNGFTFIIQNDRITALTGSARSNLVIPNSLAVRFAIRSTTNRISVPIRGEEPNGEDNASSPAVAANTGNMADGRIHTVKIAYRPGTLDVFLDDASRPLLSAPVDLSKRLKLDNGSAWVGFTAGTYSHFQNHDLLSWSFTAGPRTTADSASTAPAPLLHRSELKRFKGKMILIRLGDPLEDNDQIVILKTSLKPLASDAGLLLWIDSPNGDPDLVATMVQECRRFTGPKIALVGGGRYHGAYGQLLRLLAEFDQVARFPGAAVEAKSPPITTLEAKTASTALPASLIDPARLEYWLRLPPGAQPAFPADGARSTAKNPQEAIEKCGGELKNLELTPPIILMSKLDGKLKQTEGLLTNLSGYLKGSIAPQSFWDELNVWKGRRLKRLRTTNPHGILSSLDGFLQNANRGKVAIAKLLPLLESSPNLIRFIKTEGLATEDWRTHQFVHTVAAAKAEKSTPVVQTNQTKKYAHIELYYGGDAARLKDTTRWLDDAVFNYSRIKNELMGR